MVAGSTPNKQIAERIFARFKDRFRFQPGEDFMWSAHEQTIYWRPIKARSDIWSLLHELGHGLSGHSDYRFDINLLTLEAEAWDKAKEVARKYKLTIPEEHIETIMDGYRDWLHERSQCPNCQHTGLQTQKSTYGCLNCRCFWRVNDARKKGLKRVKLIS